MLLGKLENCAAPLTFHISDIPLILTRTNYESMAPLDIMRRHLLNVLSNLPAFHIPARFRQLAAKVVAVWFLYHTHEGKLIEALKEKNTR